MTQITSNDVTGIAALDPAYAKAADRLSGMPMDQQFNTLMSTPGIKPSTAMLIMKAGMLRQMMHGQPTQPADPSTVNQNTDAQLAAFNNQRNTGVGGLQIGGNMFGGMKAGGIVAFVEGDKVQANDSNPVGFPQGQTQDDLNSGLVQRFGAYQPPPPAQDVVPPAPKADPGTTAKLISGALSHAGISNNGTTSVSSAMTAMDPVLTKQLKEDYARRQAQYEAAVASQEADKPKTREEYENDLRAKAEANGLNDAETQRLSDLNSVADYWEKQKSKIESRSYIASAEAQLNDIYNHRLPLSPIQNALRQYTVGVGAQAAYIDSAQKAVVDAGQTLADAKYKLNDAMYKNKIGIIDKGDAQYKDAVTEHNQSIKRTDEIVNAAQKADETLAAHEAGIRQSTGMLRLYANNPSFIYAPAVLQLEKERAEFVAAHPGDLSGAAAYDEAISQVHASAVGASSATPGVVSAKTKAETAQTIANLNANTKIKIATMGDKELSKLEEQLAGLPDIPDNPQIQAMRNGMLLDIQRRKQELATMGGGSSGTEDQRQQALDWANANPKDPRAIQIKKQLGVS